MSTKKKIARQQGALDCLRCQLQKETDPERIEKTEEFIRNLEFNLRNGNTSKIRNRGRSKKHKEELKRNEAQRLSRPRRSLVLYELEEEERNVTNKSRERNKKFWETVTNESKKKGCT